MTKFKGKNFEIGGKLYKFIERIRDGGNSRVWSAESGNEKFAIKILNEGKKKERFKKEIEFCENNKHDNLIPIYDHGEIDNALCYVMPLYENNLADLVKNGISIEDGFDYIFQICSALEFLHCKDVIHRDLKPENILAKKGRLVLADLGIAHFENSSLTNKNDLLANRGYAAPEQKIKGLSKEITSAVDIFSLGMIINEIFTGKKPGGSNFTLISDIYPWLMDIDKLVENCMKQNPNERPTIKEISLEIKLQFNGLKEEKKSIEENLEYDFKELGIANICNNEIKDKIIEQAMNDILTAKHFFKNKIAQDLEKYNHNYHCNIHYKLDTRLRSTYMEYLLKEQCKRKFLHESNVYGKGDTYEPLNLNDNAEDKELYEKLSSFLYQNSIHNGEILKLFSSCCNYHCNEIIRDLDKIQKEVADLDDAPILYIVKKIMNIKDDNDDIHLENGISANWEESISCYDSKNTYMELYSEDYQKDEVETILRKFNEEYNPIVTRKDKVFVVRFADEKSYNVFKNYALELSKPYYIFEGDVLDLIRIEKEYEGIIELKPWGLFDVKNVLAKILGFRKDY
ncbi:kinase domain protein [Pseudoramibacter alactolyticus ATCC 23263]|uniref:Kinase domain protein n=1 Tax=Pseudoramibacter alactolyticus ATCC 23263 TaxID=887929 RepID=E6MJG5_9FIRM|nr:serine/threonine-protein kinase [Pseudoramibacter alactolyticus]EFV00701.1 kinase domain protein [Pseudoramibacter alactolyticus ATCC 23263]